MPRREIEMPKEDEDEICELRNAGMGSKAISKLPRFAEYGYNQIQRRFKKCPNMRSTNPSERIAKDTNLSARSILPPQLVMATIGSSPTEADLIQAGNPYTQPNSQSPSPDSNFQEMLDDADLEDETSTPSYNYTPLWMQPSWPRLLDPVKAATVEMVRTYNSRLMTMATEWGRKLAERFIPDRNVENVDTRKEPPRRNTELDELRERIEKFTNEREDKSAETESANKPGEASPGNCPCRLSEQPHSILGPRDPLGSTVRADSIQENGPESQEQSEGTDVSHAVTQPSTRPIEEQDPSTDAHASVSANPEPPGPPPQPAGALNNPETAVQQDLPEVPSRTTPQLSMQTVQAESTKLESSQDLNSNKQNLEFNGQNQPPDNKQNPVDNSVLNRFPQVPPPPPPPQVTATASPAVNIPAGVPIPPGGTETSLKDSVQAANPSGPSTQNLESGDVQQSLTVNAKMTD